MVFRIENIGRVKGAEVVLDGITVVAGNNASGKSTISKSLYAVLDSFYGLVSKARIQRTRSINRAVSPWLRNRELEATLGNPGLSEIRKEIRSIFLKKKMGQEPFIDRINSILEKHGIEDFEIEDIRELYGKYEEIEKNGTAYYQSFVIQQVLQQIFCGQINTLCHASVGMMELQSGQSKFAVEIQDNKLSDFKEGLKPQKIRPIYITTSDLMDSLGSIPKLHSAQKAGGVSYANSELTTLLMDELPLKELTAEEYQKVEEQKEMLNIIFNQVVDGNMQMEDDKLIYFDNWCQSNIAFSNVASGMKIFIILKRLVENGTFLGENLLLIDEPETNLHPEWQLKLAELLSLLHKNMGVNIYANSHSPYFVRAVEFYMNRHGTLDKSRFFFMKEADVDGMFECEDVTEKLGVIYDRLAEPFNFIM